MLYKPAKFLITSNTTNSSFIERKVNLLAINNYRKRQLSTNVSLYFSLHLLIFIVHNNKKCFHIQTPIYKVIPTASGIADKASVYFIRALSVCDILLLM